MHLINGKSVCSQKRYPNDDTSEDASPRLHCAQLTAPLPTTPYHQNLPLRQPCCSSSGIGDVDSDAPRLVAGEEVRRRATPRLLLELDIRERLLVGVADTAYKFIHRGKQGLPR